MTEQNTPGGPDDTRGLVGILVVAGAGLGASLLVWFTGELAGLICRHEWPRAAVAQSPIIAWRVLSHLGGPSDAWPVAARHAVPGAVAFYTTGMGLVVGLAAVATRVMPAARMWGGLLVGGGRRGFASLRAMRDALGEAAPRRSAAVVRPSLEGRPFATDDVAVGLGTSIPHRTKLWGSLEDSYLLLGPPRSGKGTSFLAPAIVRYPGPSVVVSTRDDLFQLTALAATREAPVLLFDPTNLSRWPGPRVSWSPVRGCDNTLTAMIRARALVRSSGAGKNVTNGDFWAGTAETVLRCYLHAAALAGKDMRGVLRWVAQQTNPEPAQILSASQSGASWAGELAGIAQGHEQTRSAIFASVGLALAPLADPRILMACCPPSPSDGFDERSFLGTKRTLHILGLASAHVSMAPIVSAMIESVVDVARREAAQTMGGRLDPPLGLFIDEARAAPIPSLGDLMADGGGSGITTFAVFQSLAQARERWGDDGADAIWDASTVRLLFPGLGNERDLERISRLLGDVDESTTSVTTGSQRSETQSTRRVPVLAVSDIRALAQWKPLVLYRGLPPVQTWLPGWWQTAARHIIEPARLAMQATLSADSDGRGDSGRMDRGRSVRRIASWLRPLRR
jgi:type IV secretion system protein VirD4